MFFNGLLRHVDQINVDEFNADCRTLFECTEDKKYHFDRIKEFNDSKWALIELSYGNASETARYLNPTPSYKKIVDHILSKIGYNYYVVSSMLAWLRPKEFIEKHVDLQKVYANTRRMHVQITQDKKAYLSVWSGEKEVQFNIEPGIIYELNNRTYHAVTHEGEDNLYSILVIDFSDVNQQFTKLDNEIKDFNLPNSNNLPSWYQSES